MDLMKFSNGALHWDLHFIKPVQDWELELLSNFMEMVYSIPLNGAGYDKICWKPNRRKGFRVDGYYRVLTFLVIYLSHGRAFGRKKSCLGCYLLLDSSFG